VGTSGINAVTVRLRKLLRRATKGSLREVGRQGSITKACVLVLNVEGRRKRISRKGVLHV
jgi:hypothetical protein